MHESLTDCLRELHLPTIRRDYESAAQRARQESMSYERYLLELAEHECESRRSSRVARRLRESRLFMEKSLSTLDLKRLPPKAAQQVRSLLGRRLRRADMRTCSFSGIPVRARRTWRARLGQELIRSGRKVTFATCGLMVQDLLAAKTGPEASRLSQEDFPI